MIKRDVNILKSHSFFLFGARGTGKTSYLKELFSKEKDILWIDLLEPSKELEYIKRPEKLIDDVNAHSGLSWVIIDEVQKVPKILDVVHKIIEERKIKFALTGSSARKLKYGGANLLAGRAFSYNLYPFSYLELNNLFSLHDLLSYGSLPILLTFDQEIEKKKFLESYCLKYLKEEVFLEQLVRKTDGFRIFLEIAARENTNCINYSKIARDIGIDYQTVKTFYEILEDTLIVNKLNYYHKSLRKQQLKQPKYYFFDCGVLRFLNGNINGPLNEGSYEYGKVFETFIIQEIIKQNSYLNKNFKLSYLKTNNGFEVDLIIERYGKKDLFIEIKSSRSSENLKISSFIKFKEENPEFDYMCLYNGNSATNLKGLDILPWRIAIDRIFNS